MNSQLIDNVHYACRFSLLIASKISSSVYFELKWDVLWKNKKKPSGILERKLPPPTRKNTKIKLYRKQMKLDICFL